jgi:type IV pilus assembly protein PilW
MNQQQHGMTLIELMISMVLSLSLIAGIGSLFLNMQKSNRIQRALATMADDSSYVQEVLQKEIRRTGGLRSRSDINGTANKIFLNHPNVLNTDPALDPAIPHLQTSINFNVSDYIKGISIAPDNDTFAIRYQLLDKQDLNTGDTSNGSSPCTQNILLDRSGIDPTTELCMVGAPASTCEDPGSEEHVANVYFYLDGDSLSCTAQRTLPNTISALETCAQNCTSSTNFLAIKHSVELIHNAVQLVMRYGVDSDADNAANYYTDAATVPTAASCPDLNGINESCWKHIVSVRLSVVVSSEEDHLTTSPMSYQVEGVTYTPADFRIYKAFTTTIALRNQLL